MHVTLQTLSAESQNLNLVFSGSIVFSLRAPVQPVRCAGLGEVAGGPPQRGRTETTPLEPRAISSEYGTLFVKRCTTPLYLVGDITAQKLLFTQESSFLGIHLNPPSSPDSGRWARGGFSDEAVYSCIQRKCRSRSEEHTSELQS